MNRVTHLKNSPLKVACNSIVERERIASNPDSITVTLSGTRRPREILIRNIAVIEPVHPYDPSHQQVTKLRLISNDQYVVMETSRQIIASIYEAGKATST